MSCHGELMTQREDFAFTMHRYNSSDRVKMVIVDHQ